MRLRPEERLEWIRQTPMSLRTRYACLLGTVLSVMLCTSSGWAVQPVKPVKPDVSGVAEALETGRTPAAATLEKIMEAATRNIAIRYNLDEAQRAYTEMMMKTEVRRFLKEHENEVWPVIGDLLRTRLGLDPPDREDAMRIGKAAKPLLGAAREYIFKANEEWRAILNPEQLKVHDFDLADMNRQFDVIGGNFDSWAEGEPNPGGIFPRSPKGRGQPKRPLKPDVVQPQHRMFDPNPMLATLVEEFIKAHKLDDGQITAARSILEEFKGKANDVTVSKKRELAAALAARNDALQRRDRPGLKKAVADHKKLLKPIYQLCDQMTERLEGLLTTAQRQRQANSSGDDEPASKAPHKVNANQDAGADVKPTDTDSTSNNGER